MDGILIAWAIVLFSASYNYSHETERKAKGGAMLLAYLALGVIVFISLEVMFP